MRVYNALMRFLVKVSATGCVWMATQDGWLTAAAYLSLQTISNAIRAPHED